MINFIIYEDEEKMKNMYKDIIHNFFGNINDGYKIIEYDEYKPDLIKKIESIEGKKIFLMDIEVPGKTGLELAREIRNNGDWLSPLIIITTHEHLKTEGFTGRMLMLDFLSKYNDLRNSLKDSIMTAYNIVSSYKTISFKQKGEIYQILYEDILYIEKNLNDNYVTIETKHDSITIKGSINNIISFLSADPRFMKTHRSCIVNLVNIKIYDISNNLIRFEEKTTDLISREKKKELKERLSKYQLV